MVPGFLSLLIVGESQREKKSVGADAQILIDVEHCRVKSWPKGMAQKRKLCDLVMLLNKTPTCVHRRILSRVPMYKGTHFTDGMIWYRTSIIIRIYWYLVELHLLDQTLDLKKVRVNNHQAHALNIHLTSCCFLLLRSGDVQNHVYIESSL